MQPDQAWSAAAPWEQAGRAQWWWPEQQQQQYQPARSLQQQLQHAPSVPVPLPPAPQQQQAWQGQMQRSPAELAFLKGAPLPCVATATQGQVAAPALATGHSVPCPPALPAGEYETALQLSCGDDPPRPDSGWPRVSRERIHGFSALQVGARARPASHAPASQLPLHSRRQRSAARACAADPRLSTPAPPPCMLQRECFLQLLLRYGVPEAAEAAPGLDWAPLCRRMPGKDPADVAQVRTCAAAAACPLALESVCP